MTIWKLRFSYLTLKFYCIWLEIKNFKPKYPNFEKQLDNKIGGFADDYGRVEFHFLSGYPFNFLSIIYF